MKRKNISLKIRYLLFEKYNNSCVYCGISVSDGAVLQIDHIIPVSKGGGNNVENLTVACRECNLGKGDMSEYTQEQIEDIQRYCEDPETEKSAHAKLKERLLARQIFKS